MQSPKLFYFLVSVLEGGHTKQKSCKSERVVEETHTIKSFLLLLCTFFEAKGNVEKDGRESNIWSFMAHITLVHRMANRILLRWVLDFVHGKFSRGR